MYGLMMLAKVANHGRGCQLSTKSHPLLLPGHIARHHLLAPSAEK